jgi:signal transduction histidine kinase
MYDAYKQSSQFPQALDAYISYVATKDSASQIDKINEAMRKDLEIANHDERQRQRTEYEKAIDRARLRAIGGYGGLVLVLALAFFIYRSYKTQRKLNALLSKEKVGHLAHIQAQSDVLSDIAHIQAHEVRGPVSAIMGFVQIFNFDDPTDPNNKQVMEWIGVTAEKLDSVVRNVVAKENDLRSEHEAAEKVDQATINNRH